MKILVDMNLSPRWAETFRAAGIDAVHWSEVGSASAEDEVILAWAIANRHIVFSHDLDFSAILAASRGQSPSVVQIRSENLDPESLASTLIESIRRTAVQLEAGAIVTVEPKRSRVRLLPLKPETE
jgi:predicted nuclease of predicted toxin-antitoxin system